MCNYQILLIYVLFCAGAYMPFGVFLFQDF